MLVGVILSGGSGTRLWPVSREAAPKPFMRFGAGPSLLQRALLRALHAGAERLLIVTNKEYQFRTLEELDELGMARRGVQATLLLEPMARNTAPAIAAAALASAALYGDDATLLVLPADHLVHDEPRFAQRVALAARLARDTGRIGLFGIVPALPETGFGYIEAGAPLADSEARAVVRFVEKPDAATAQRYVAAGNYFWNSGMFAFTARTMLDELAVHAPEALAAARAALGADPVVLSAPPVVLSAPPVVLSAPPVVLSAAKDLHGTAVTLDADAFAKAPDISIDYAVMERTDRVALVPGDFGWSDIGSWKAVAEEFDTDASGNSSSGEVILAGCENVHAQSSERLVAAVGVKDVVIVDTADALLVCDRNDTQRVKEVVAELRRRGHEAHRLHKTVARPWGTYTTLHEGARFKIKRIEVKPGASLSSQMHHHRSEHWVVVSGTARVEVAEREALLAPNQSTYIPVGARHRLANPGKMPLVIIEVQCGDYVGEDDIVRFDDRYGRVQPAA